MLNAQYIQMSVNEASTICGHVSTVFTKCFVRRKAYTMNWPILLVKETTTQSSPYSGNERQRSVNNLCLCKYSN
jgi:hypothetical protein